MKEHSVDFVFALSCIWWWWDQWATYMYFESTSYYSTRPWSSVYC